MKKIYIYPSCISVQGYSRGIIQDLYRSKYVFAPKWLISFFEKHNYRTINQLKNAIRDYDEESQLESYVNFLVENEIIYITDKNVKFQEISLVFDAPSTITNSIIIFNNINQKKLITIIGELEDLGCENVQLYFPEIFDSTILSYILSFFDDSIIQYIELITNYNTNYDSFEKIAELFSNNKRLFTLHLVNAPEEKEVFIDVFHIKHIIFSTEEFNFTICGQVHPIFFTNNISFFTESKSYNTCLNRKICIDSDGYIKNCPSMKHHYGHISDTTLAEAIEKPGFKDCWSIKKDDIDVCQDCEFRHICTDCRAFIKDPNNIYSQPAKCGYNPYIAKWQNEEGWISVEQWRTENPGWEEQAIELRELNKKYIGANE